MDNSDEDETILALISLGILAVAGIGLLKVLKSIGSYRTGEVVSTTQATTLPIPDRERTRKYGHCPIHGAESEQCQDDFHYDKSNRCMECNGGVGDEFDRWCENCDWDRRNDD
jgi:hypothetical protein